MSQYQDGIKLKTTTPSVALLKLLRKWYPNQSRGAGHPDSGGPAADGTVL